MGNALTWPFPVLYRVVKGASPERVVLQGAAGLLDNFLEAAADLVAQGRRRSPPIADFFPSTSARSPPMCACRWRRVR